MSQRATVSKVSLNWVAQLICSILPASKLQSHTNLRNAVKGWELLTQVQIYDWVQRMPQKMAPSPSKNQAVFQQHSRNSSKIAVCQLLISITYLLSHFNFLKLGCILQQICNINVLLFLFSQMLLNRYSSTDMQGKAWTDLLPSRAANLCSQ